MKNAAAGRDPLDIASSKSAGVAEAVAMLDRAGEHVSVRGPGEAGAIVFRAVVAEIIAEKEGIELTGVAEAKGAAQFHPGEPDAPNAAIC